MGPYRADHFPALRAAVGIAVPLLVLLILDRPDLSLYAVFGAFSGVYGRMSGYRERLFQQSQAALIMLATVFVALWLGRLAPGPWTLVLLTALAAAAATVLATLLRFGPVGGFFAIFAFAAISHSPGTVPGRRPRQFGRSMGATWACKRCAIYWRWHWPARSRPCWGWGTATGRWSAPQS
ncbi:hypothetical protein [Arthrobacter russicus]|uniref:FUSC family protein n=1 Tax=Arthrobacter russicus TaxID=172040 RepID=A0ABU1JD62_9MICC|nr:hypothetical protein [Arthrobacter russicus]MDR6269821.1 hypothetical protein [Arthrobacter russicus]